MSALVQNLPSVPRAPRYESLDLWRGIACIAVVIYHSSYYAQRSSNSTGLEFLASELMVGINWLWLGVPMFFVISGYCISASVDSARRKKSHSAINYFAKRFRRIYPPYWAVVLVSGIAVILTERFLRIGVFTDENHVIPDPLSLTVWQWLGNLTLTETWRHNFGGDATNFFLGQAWTLCYEEQFYIICGIILAVAPKRFFPITFAVSVLVLPLSVICNRMQITGVFCDGQWMNFYAGILVYYHVNYAGAKFRRMIEVLFFAAIVTFWLDPLGKWSRASLFQQGFIAFGFGLLLIGLQSWDRKIARWKGGYLLQAVGVMCYSVYLVHWPICKAVSHASFLAGWTSNLFTVLVVIPVSLALSLLVGYAFHIAVERKFIEQRKQVPSDVLSFQRADMLSLDRAA